MGEFDLIRRYFDRKTAPDSAVVLGVGDDCALLQPSPGYQLAVSCDMLVEGRHFFPDVAPDALGHKTLAVNLSDLAAMGARPLGFTLALSLPRADEDWIARFAQGLFALAERSGCPLVGGDTTRGPLNLCVTVFGEVLPGRALRRDQALAGDDIWISGRLGEARLALEQRLGTEWAQAVHQLDDMEPAHRLDWPQPRNALGQSLAGVARACIDISDGLAGDLAHILRASAVGAQIHIDQLPVAPSLVRLPISQRLDCMVNGGDDYELLFCAAAAQRGVIKDLSAQTATPVTRVGQIVAGNGLQWLDAQGKALGITSRGFDHFG